MEQELGLNNINPEEENIGVSPLGVEQVNELLTSGNLRQSENSTLLGLLTENPEIVLSEITRVLNLLENTGWWYVITPVLAQDGTKLARISLAPPEGYGISILENNSTGIKKIVLNKK